jgi:hypothetical protein
MLTTFGRNRKTAFVPTFRRMPRGANVFHLCDPDGHELSFARPISTCVNASLLPRLKLG